MKKLLKHTGTLSVDILLFIAVIGVATLATKIVWTYISFVWSVW